MESNTQSLYYYAELPRYRKNSSATHGAVFTLVPVCSELIKQSKALQLAKRLYGFKKDIEKISPEALFKVMPISAASNTWHAFRASGQFYGTQHEPEEIPCGDYPVMSINEILSAVASGEVCPMSYFLVGTEFKFPLEMSPADRAK